jgi:hypothetical protein
MANDDGALQPLSCSSQSLGRIERVDLREVWTSEPMGFTPWLADPENLAELSKALGMELELEGREIAVGPFSADILCKDIGTDTWVLIENQLERTDHTHLGQLLTYASGLDAVTITWIASRFTEEHRAALDWLNKITNDDIRFFGLEVELWKIASSPAAPKFNIVSKPNNWSRLVSQRARAIDESELSDTRLMQRDYWADLGEVLDRYGGPVLGNRKPQPQSWMSYPIGHAKMFLGASMNMRLGRIKAELYLTGPKAKLFFAQLYTQKDAIEGDLGYALTWEELPEGRDSRISVSLNNVKPDERAEWPRQQEWLAKHLNDLHRVFAQRVNALKNDRSLSQLLTEKT